MWGKFTQSCPCPVCGSHDGSCRVSPDGDLILCLRVETGCIIRSDGSKAKAKNGMGFFHANKPSNGNGHKRVKPNGDATRKLTATECRNIMSEYVSDCDASCYEMGYIKLGISIDSLKAYGMGWDKKTLSFAFPMYGGTRKIVGIRLRSPDGAIKRTVLHSSNGIFLPADYDAAAESQTFLCDAIPPLLLVPEGPTDAGALRDMGFRAIGRPSNMGGADEIRDLLKSDPPRMRQDVVIVSDNDPVKWSPDGVPFVPGWEGALHLADYIIPFANTLRIIRPPNFKDVRAWFNQGGSVAILEQLINEAAPITRATLNEKLAAMSSWKDNGRADWQRKHGKAAG